MIKFVLKLLCLFLNLKEDERREGKKQKRRDNPKIRNNPKISNAGNAECRNRGKTSSPDLFMFRFFLAVALVFFLSLPQKLSYNVHNWQGNCSGAVRKSN